MSTNWCIAIKYRRSSSIRVIFVNYQTSKLQYNYQSYIQGLTIGDAQGFSSITPIALSRGFSGGILIGVWLFYRKLSQIGVRTLSWKTKSDKSILVIKDGISGIVALPLQEHVSGKVAAMKNKPID